MKMKLFLTAALMGVLALGTQVLAADAEGEGKGKRRRGRRPWMRKEILKKFDKDGDGKLNEAERAEAKKAWEAKQAETLKKFDADGDGKLNAKERKAAHAARRQEMILKKFDKDGDGKLNAEEQKAADAAKAEMETKHQTELDKRDALLAAYTGYDGFFNIAFRCDF